MIDASFIVNWNNVWHHDEVRTLNVLKFNGLFFFFFTTIPSLATYLLVTFSANVYGSQRFSRVRRVPRRHRKNDRVHLNRVAYRNAIVALVNNRHNKNNIMSQCTLYYRKYFPFRMFRRMLCTPHSFHSPYIRGIDRRAGYRINNCISSDNGHVHGAPSVLIPSTRSDSRKNNRTQ